MGRANNEFLATWEVAELLEVNRKTVYRYIHRGLLRARWVGGWKVTRADVAECADRLGRNKLGGGTIEGRQGRA